MTQHKVLRLVWPPDVGNQPLLRARQKSASWLLVVCEEIEKLEFDPIIITPENPSRLHMHMLQILRILREVLRKTYMIFNIYELKI